MRSEFPFGYAQGPPFDTAQGPPFDTAQGPPFDTAQGPPFDTAQGPPFGYVQGTGRGRFGVKKWRTRLMPYMYILECSDGSYYTGSTWNLEKRLYEHQKGLGANHTAKRLPVKLIYCEECDRIEDAFQREKQVQGWSRRKKEALMAGDSNMLHQLAECRNETHHGFDYAQPPHDYAQPPHDYAQPPHDYAQPPHDYAQPPHDCAQPPQNYDKTPHGFTQSLDPPRPLSGAKVEARHVLDVHREENGE